MPQRKADFQKQMTAAKRCWTCKDRKVACDRATPVCLKCSRAKRACGGYGVRLSWPDPSNSKRALKDSTFIQSSTESARQLPIQWINVSLNDVCLHVVATNTGGQSSRVSRSQLSLPSIPSSISHVSKRITVDEMELLHYFKSVVSGILPMLGPDRQRIRDILFRMALSETTLSANAVLLSLLALSSYHRGGVLEYASHMKDAALRALIAAADPEMDSNAAIRHVAAGLILCLVEIQQQPYDGSEWVGYACGAKQVIHAVKQVQPLPGSDAAVILGWIYYFHVFPRFSLRHWRTDMIEATANALGFKPSAECALQCPIARASFSREVPIISAFAHPLLLLLSAVFNTRLYPSDPEYHSSDYQQSLNNLSFQLENLVLAPSEQDSMDDNSVVVELTRLAALIYLERASTNFSGQSAKLDSWTRSGQAIFAALRTSPCPFTLFIFGCEAHEDEERLVLLRLFTRLEQQPHLQSLLEVKGLIQTAWTQHDLEADGRLEYIHKVNLVLSSRDIVPSFL